MALPEYRVQLTDPTTHAAVSDVDVLTNTSAIIYENEKKTVADFRGIEKGTAFPPNGDAGIRLQTILDNILYPHIEPAITKFDMGLIKDITEDTNEYIEFNDWKDQFYANLEIQVGSENSLELSVKRRDVTTGVISSTTTTVTVIPGSTYVYQPAITKIDKDTIVSIEIYDGISTVVTPSVYYKIQLPVFVGLCDLSEVYDEYHNTIITDDANTYFQTLIRNSDGLVNKLLTDISDVNGFSVLNPIYNTVRKHPFVLYPNTWNKPYSITDTNSDNIIGSYIYNSSLSIKPNSKGSTACQYTVYICKNPYYCNLAALDDLRYNFDVKHMNDANIIDFINHGAPNMSGFDVLANIPCDWRTLVDTMDDLEAIQFPYEGLITYVKEEHSFFKYTSDETWVPTNQQTHLISAGKAPDLELGGWNDICIDLKTNIFYQKHKNIRWEEKGRIIGGAAVLNYSETTVYKTDDLVIQDGVVYRALRDGIVNIIPGTDATAWEATEISGGTPGPVGPAGDAATIEIVGTEVVDDVKDVTVVNLGDKQNARLLFKVPGGEAVRGPKGDTGPQGPKGEDGADGRAATVALGVVSAGNRFDVTNVGTVNDAILNITYPEALDYFNNGGTLYPVGTVYQTVDPEYNPNENLPGHWEYIGTTKATDETGITTSIRVFKNVGGDN